MNLGPKLWLFLPCALLVSCTTVRPGVCPAWPEPDPKMAQELEVMLPEAENPHFWDWMDRVYKLRDKLEACRN